MTAGRPPLPTHLKIVKGTARPHRLNENEPMPPLVAPEPPDHLDERAKAKFTQVAEMLARHGIMTELDCQPTLSPASQSCGAAGSMPKPKLKSAAPWSRPPPTTSFRTRFWAVANKCLLQMAQIESEFGLTPSSRSPHSYGDAIRHCRPRSRSISIVAKKRKPACPVKAYARAVVSGKIVAGKLVKLACKRHLSDLTGGKDRGLVWDEAAALHAIAFFSHLRHSTGEWANQPFELQPWQCFIVGSLYGWKRADGLRRFRTSYVEVARKNGKSVLLAGTALYALVGGRRTWIACLWPRRRHATRHASFLAKPSGWLMPAPRCAQGITRTVNNLAVMATSSWFRPLSADATKMDGLNVHFAAVDEVHEHPNAEINSEAQHCDRLAPSAAYL